MTFTIDDFYLEEWCASFSKSPMWDEEGQAVALIKVSGASYGARQSLLGYDKGGYAPDTYYYVRKDGSGAAGTIAARGTSGEEYSLMGYGVVRTASSNWLPDNAVRDPYTPTEYRDPTSWTGEVYPECWDDWVSPDIQAARRIKAERKASKAETVTADNSPFSVLLKLKK